jgi:hypothetical protein
MMSVLAGLMLSLRSSMYENANGTQVNLDPRRRNFVFEVRVLWWPLDWSLRPIHHPGRNSTSHVVLQVAFYPLTVPTHHSTTGNIFGISLFHPGILHPRE